MKDSPGSLRENMGVSKNRGTPKWMVIMMANPIKIHDLEVPLFLETPILHLCIIFCLNRRPDKKK